MSQITEQPPMAEGGLNQQVDDIREYLKRLIKYINTNTVEIEDEIDSLRSGS